MSLDYGLGTMTATTYSNATGSKINVEQPSIAAFYRIRHVWSYFNRRHNILTIFIPKVGLAVRKNL